MLGTLLTWLNDHTSDVYTIVTANNVSILPPEFTRAGRFDALFFVDLPDEAARGALWAQYIKEYEIPGEKCKVYPDDEDWTGAEIANCCRLSRLMNYTLKESSAYVIANARTAGDKIQSLREWATGKAICAERGGPYAKEKPKSGKSEGSRRTVHA